MGEEKRFIPTLYSCALHGAKTGEPIIRPMFCDHMDKPELYAADDRFYLGEHILIAPVTEAGAQEREVYLPDGSWVDLWTKERFSGGRSVVCSAPLFKKEGLPMFIRVGGGAAYQPDCMYLDDVIPECLRGYGGGAHAQRKRNGNERIPLPQNRRYV